MTAARGRIRPERRESDLGISPGALPWRRGLCRAVGLGALATNTPCDASREARRATCSVAGWQRPRDACRFGLTLARGLGPLVESRERSRTEARGWGVLLVTVIVTRGGSAVTPSDRRR